MELLVLRAICLFDFSRVTLRGIMGHQFSCVCLRLSVYSRSQRQDDVMDRSKFGTRNCHTSIIYL